MRPAAHRLRLEEELAGVLRGEGDSSWFQAASVPGPETVPTGIPEIDNLTGGLPKGQITEIIGMASSGSTSLLHSLLAKISSQNEAVGLIDPGNAFDPGSAAAFGVQLDRLLWIRAGQSPFNIQQVLKTTDLLLQGGGFGLIGVDLSNFPPQDIRRVSTTPWFRLQRAAENTSTVLLFLNPEPTLKTTAGLVLQMNVAQTEWSRGFLCEFRSGARVVRSRHAPASCRQTDSFRLYPVACIAAGHTGNLAMNSTSSSPSAAEE